MKLRDQNDAIRPHHILAIIGDCMRPMPGGGLALSPREKRGVEPWLGDEAVDGGLKGVAGTRAAIVRMKERGENYDGSPANLKAEEVGRLGAMVVALDDLLERVPELAAAAALEGVSRFVPAL